MHSLIAYLNLSPELFEKIVLSLVIVIVLSLGRILVNIIIKRRIADAMKAYRWRRTILYTYTLLLLVWVGSIWTKGIASLATFMGLASAGLAIAMHDTIANLAGWFFIIWRKPFKVGDRIEIGEIAGDVIDIRIFQFSMVEIGHWVDADQSTGRIVHVPNSKVLREPLANYHIGSLTCRKHLSGVVGTSHKRAGCHFFKSGIDGKLPPSFEFFRRDEIDHRQMPRGGLKVLADGEHAAAGTVDVGDGLSDFCFRFSQTQHDAGFGRDGQGRLF